MVIRNTAKRISRSAIPLAVKALHPGRWFRSADPATPPKKILLLNSGGIGDIVITTGILPILRSAYPGAEIGFVASNLCSMALRDHPEIAHVHCLDDWGANRIDKGALAKLKRYRATRRTALREICAVGYDMALAVRPGLSDFLDLAWVAGIPVRAGFRESVLANFATHLADLPANDFMHQGARQVEILRPLGVADIHMQKRRMVLAESSAEAVQEVAALLGIARIEDARYRIIHMGAGALNKELSPEFWHEVAAALSQTGTLLFTGSGDRESANIVLAMAGLKNCVNACGRLSWDGFVAAVRYAEVLYGVDSMAGHVAAAVGTRCVMAYTGTGGVARWRPETALATVFTNHLPCAPCKANGCKEMTCIRKIAPSELIHG